MIIYFENWDLTFKTQILSRNSIFNLINQAIITFCNEKKISKKEKMIYQRNIEKHFQITALTDIEIRILGFATLYQQASDLFKKMKKCVTNAKKWEFRLEVTLGKTIKEDLIYENDRFVPVNAPSYDFNIEFYECDMEMDFSEKNENYDHMKYIFNQTIIAKI